MKLSLRNLALAGALALSGAMFAQDAPTVKLNWVKNLSWDKDLPGLDKNETRFGTGFGGKVFFNDKANKKVMVVDANGATEYASLDALGTAITVDGAGNLLVGTAFLGLVSTTNFVAIKPDGTQQPITLTWPEGTTAASNQRVDQIGRIAGDIFSEEGAFVYMNDNATSKYAMFYLQEGAQAANSEIEYYDAAKPSAVALNSSTIIQPMYDFQTIQDMGDDAIFCAAMRNRSTKSIWYYDFEKSAWAAMTTPAGANSQEGFDVFTLGETTYQVSPIMVSANYESAFVIADESGNIIYTDENAVLGDKSQSFGSFAVEYVDDETVNLYQWFTSGAGARAAMWTISIAQEENPDPLYIVGNATKADWDPAQAEEFAYANGVYVYDFGHQEATMSFKVSTTGGATWDDFNAGVIGAKLVLNEAVAIDDEWNTNENLTFPGNGTYQLVVDLKNRTIKLEGELDPAEAPASAEVYLRGGVTSWNADPKYQFKDAGTEGYFRIYELYVEGTVDGTFKIADAEWGSINYGATGSNNVAMVGPRVELAPGGGDISAGPDGSGLTNITFKFYHSGAPGVNSYLMVMGGDQAVSTIAVDNNAKAVYFNLQGVQVENPANGLYIRVQDGKAAKVLVK